MTILNMNDLSDIPETLKSDDLKPCPFCGSLARYKIGTFDNTNITEVHVVINHNKKCILRNTHSDLPVYVIESWNTRILEKRGIK